MHSRFRIPVAGSAMAPFDDISYAGAIAIFDSGVGGLTVARAIREVLPQEDLIYFGDTARVPYGIKSPDTIIRFARQDADFLMRFHPRILVVACNTASAVAVEQLQRDLSVPVVGVVKPGARAAVAVTHNGHIGVVGTETTIASSAYQRAICALLPDARVLSCACPLLVPMVEEGRTGDDPIARAAIAEYLGPFLASSIDTLILGCTHYPLLRDAIESCMGPAVTVVDASRETALEIKRVLHASSQPSDAPSGRCYFLASDNPRRFALIGSRFMGTPIRKVFQVEQDEFLQANPS